MPAGEPGPPPRRGPVGVGGLDGRASPGAKTGSDTSLLGLVKHLGGVEYQWFCPTFDVETEPLESEPLRDMTPGPVETAAEIVAFYLRAHTAADAVVARHDLEDVGVA